MTIRTALCFLTCHLTAAPLVLAQAPPAPTGRVIRENVSWADVPARVTNRRVLVALTDGSFATGRVTNVTGAEIELRGRDRPVPRDSVKFVQYEIAKGKSRARWAVGLALAGIGIAVLLGAGEQLGGENAAHFATVAVGLAGGGAAAGYAIGRRRDRLTYVLTIR